VQGPVVEPWIEADLPMRARMDEDETTEPTPASPSASGSFSRLEANLFRVDANAREQVADAYLRSLLDELWEAA